MTLCTPCSKVDFGRCFFNESWDNNMYGNGPSRALAAFVEQRDTCALCALVCTAVESRDPSVLDSAITNMYSHCDMNDLGQDPAAPGILSVRVGANSMRVYGSLREMDGRDQQLRFNLVEAGPAPVPMRARLLEELRERRALVDMMKTWVGTCKANHPQCSQQWQSTRPDDLALRLIDVRRECLVDAPPDASYAALSYVRSGGAGSMRASRADIERFSVEGALGDDACLSATISSAISLVDAMGTDYLWVHDACIAHDDAEDVASHVRHMAHVLGNADFTIVQATGWDGTSPLLGFDTPYNTTQVVGEVVPNITLALQRPPELPDVPSDPSWRNMAWPYQDAMLSPRLLVWHEGVVSWECREAVWADDVVLGSAAAHYTPKLRTRLPTSIVDSLTPPRPRMQGHDDALAAYEAAVFEFSAREAPSATDKISAFAGIGGVMARSMGTRLLFNTPLNALDTALLWAPGFKDGNITGFIQASVEPFTGPWLARMPRPQRLPDLPSWSWAGWSGRAAKLLRMWILPVASYYIHDQDANGSDDGDPARPASVTLTRLRQFWEDVAASRPTERRILKNTDQHPPRVEAPPFKVVDSVPPGADLTRCLCVDTLCTPALPFRLAGNDVILRESDTPVGNIELNLLNPSETNLSNMEMVALSLCFRETRHAWPAAGDTQGLRFFPDPATDETVPFVRQRRTRLPMTCCLVMLVEKTDRGTYERRGVGEISTRALEHVGQKRKWVFLE